MSLIDTVIFDLDGTLTRVPSPWRYIHERLGLWEETARYFFEEWLSGRIGYEEFCRRDVRLWEGRCLGELETLLSEIEMNRHVSGVVERLEEAGVKSFIVSTGFGSVARRLQERLGWWSVEVYANELVVGPDIRMNVSADLDSVKSKKRIAESLVKEAGMDPDRTLVVSDSPMDLEMMAMCRHQLLVANEHDLGEVHRMLGPTHQASRDPVPQTEPAA